VLLSACGDDDGSPASDAPPGSDGTIPDGRLADAPPLPDSGDCFAAPLDAETLANLVISFEPEISMRPGQTFQFDTSLIECCYFLTPVNACATWSVTPTVGASIDEGGLLTIAGDTPHGATFTVSADVESGRRIVSATVHVYTPEANPLVGLWREAAQFECGSGAEAAPERVINELRFTAAGRFAATWIPFEVYVDYWGSSVDGGNYVPPDVDGTGALDVTSTELRLRDLWLGTPMGSTAPARCGHRFVR
jgi:hypothetical protein